MVSVQFAYLIERAKPRVQAWLKQGISVRLNIPFRAIGLNEDEYFQDWIEIPEMGVEGHWGMPYIYFVASDDRSFATCALHQLRISADEPANERFEEMSKYPQPLWADSDVQWLRELVQSRSVAA